MSDKANPRYFMGVGLILTGIINILFGFSSSVLAFTVLWGFNAFFQGWGWPPCTKIMTTWYSRNERGFWWALCNTSHNVGGAIIPLLAAYLASQYSWRYGMIVPGVIGIVIGLAICIFLRDRPRSMGLPSVGEWRNDSLEQDQVKQSSTGLSTWQILQKYVLTNKFIWLLALSYILVYIVRIGMNDWANTYLVEKHGVSLVVANSAIALFEVGGFLGTIFAGWGSDYFFRGNRVPMNIIFMAGITAAVVALWLLPLSSYWALGFTFFMLGFFIFGPQMLTGIAAAEVAHKDSAGAATGFVGFFGYVFGATVSGAPLAWTIKAYGWDAFYMVITGASILSALIIIPIINPKKAQV